MEDWTLIWFLRLPHKSFQRKWVDYGKKKKKSQSNYMSIMDQKIGKKTGNRNRTAKTLDIDIFTHRLQNNKLWNERMGNCQKWPRNLNKL